MLDEGLLGRLVAEGKRVGRNPWCASACYETAAYERLNTRWPKIDYPQESFWESYGRWLEEGRITQEEYDKAKKDEDRHKCMNKLFKIKDALNLILNEITLSASAFTELAYNSNEVNKEIDALLLEK